MTFPIGPFLQQDLSEEEAVAAALRKAKSHRELVRKGLLKPLKKQSAPASRNWNARIVQVKKPSEMKRFEPLGPQLGVRWSLGGQC